MVHRDLTKELREAAKEYPVVAVFGPRQSGKTTIVQTTFPSKRYLSLEDPDVRRSAELDPRGFLTGLERGAVLDEIQRAPHLLSYIQGIVDRLRKPGLFILTGSHQPKLHEAISQTLAGRCAILTLLPFSWSELAAHGPPLDPFQLIVTGSFPKVHSEGLKTTRFYNGYVQTYLERDVRSLINIRDLSRFQHFMTLLAGRIGQIVNYTSLSNDLGVSSTTVKDWVSVLKASYIVFELPPFFENVRKRVVRSPKVYFSDTGIACYFLGITEREHALRDPLRGGLYENLVILEILKERMNRGLRPELFFYRDTHGNEVDLVIRSGRNLVPVEIKSSATFTEDYLRGVENFTTTLRARVQPGFILYNGELETRIGDIRVLNPFTKKGFTPFASA